MSTLKLRIGGKILKTFPKKELTILACNITLIIVSLYLAPVIRFGIILNPDCVFELTFPEDNP
jgi:hypothetical protein